MEGRRPDELKAPSSRVRLALAVGTGVLPAVQQGLVKALPKLRHEFAHGEIDELTPKRAQELLAAFDGLLSDEIRTKLWDAAPIHSLRFAMLAARVVIDSSAEVALARRAEIY